MNSTFKYKSLKVGTFCLCLYLFSIAIVRVCESNQKNNKKLIGLQPIIYQTKEAIKTKNYNILKKYVSHKKLLYWAQCNSDVGTNISFDKMVHILMDNAKNANIYVNEEAQAGLIETEGWTGEYPFLYFDFIKNGNNWKWRGVCYDVNRSLDYFLSKDTHGKLYKPKLPRPGARIFKDNIALRARIEEIVKFGEFEALKPYATKKKLIFGECNRKMLEKDRMEGEERPVENVIGFLNKNAASSKEIKSSRGHHITYYDTEGWGGEYPYISFWFDEGKQGWELTGLAYCKTSLMKLSYPNDPQIK